MQDDEKANQINCPRCDTVVRSHVHSLQYSLAMAISALIVFLPAITLPILTFKLGEMQQESTMLSALYYFYEGGYSEISALVFFTTILAPFVQIILSINMYASLIKRRRPKYMKLCYKTLHHLRTWVMLDVYVVAILVTIVKLSATAELIYETGLVLFVALSVFSFLLCNSFESKYIWKAYHNAH